MKVSKTVREGDIIRCRRIFRLGREQDDLLAVVKELNAPDKLEATIMWLNRSVDIVWAEDLELYCPDFRGQEC